MKALKTKHSLNILALILALAGSFYTGSAQGKDVDQKPAVVFDLGGVLFNTSKRVFFKQELGRNALPYMLLHHSKTCIKDRWFETLDRIAQEQHHSYQVTDDEGMVITLKDDSETPLPTYMVEWLCGVIPNSCIYHEVRQAIKEHPEWFGPFEQRLMLNMTRGIFRPKRFAASRKLIEPTVALIKKLKKQGYPLYILSNWDSETFSYMKTQHEELFALFDGIMISGEVHIAKPSKDIFKIFMMRYPHNAYCFIDDQQDNIDAAQQCGWSGIKTESGKPNIKMIKKELASART